MTTDSAGAAPADGLVTERRRDALHDVYVTEYGALARFAYRLTGDASAAEDIVHEAFTRALTRWLTVSKPVPFLYRTVANLATDAWRRSQRDARAGRALEGSGVTQPFDPSVRDAVRRLPRAEREAVTLYYFADLRIDQVSQLLGKPEGTVKWLLASARDRLATQLGGPDA